ncbi:MAG: hypothetical protein PHT96_03835 [Syntrophorhabdaceae bacterium]|nr:hypothetical protein [Syntrophorhabdaceae bacterium]
MNNEMIEDQLSLEYHGASVETGRMNSYDVASYILAFSDFMGIASRTAYGEQILLKTEIQGFKNNSFDIIFALQIAGVAFGILLPTTSFSVKDFVGLLKDSIQAWLHLNGNPPKEITAVPGKQNIFEVENQSGQLQYFTADVINIITHPKAGRSVEQFIRKPLENGLSSVGINSRHTNEIISIGQESAPCFVPVDIEKPLLENEMRMGLIIESPTFKEGNKWRFFDGQNSFYADILDEDFIKKVDLGVERFGKGDRLIALVRFTQSSAIGSLRMERKIVRVLDHEIAGKAESLFPSD